MTLRTKLRSLNGTFRRLAPSYLEGTTSRTTPKRLAIILGITVPSILLIMLAIFTGMLYQEFVNQQKDFGVERTKWVESLLAESQDATEFTAVDLLEEIVTIYRNNYVGGVDEDELKTNLLAAFYASLDDKYSTYYTAEQYAESTQTLSGTAEGIGVSVIAVETGLRITAVYKNSAAAEAGLMAEDIITAVSGQSVVGLSTSDAVALIKGTGGEAFTLTYVRDGVEAQVELATKAFTVTSVEKNYVEHDGKTVAVIAIDNFYANMPEELYAAIEEAEADGCAGIVFDVRDNPGGYLDCALAVLDYLLPEGPLVHLRFKDEAKNTTQTSDATYHCDLPMAVLINGNTASSAELFTSALQDYDRATIVGTTSYGKGCGQEIKKLSDGSAIKLTMFYYDPPYSENYDGVGITPDVEVELADEYKNVAVSAIPEGADTQLLRALDIVCASGE